MSEELARRHHCTSTSLTHPVNRVPTRLGDVVHGRPAYHPSTETPDDLINALRVFLTEALTLAPG